jgi:hypothetical protein
MSTVTQTAEVNSFSSNMTIQLNKNIQKQMRYINKRVKKNPKTSKMSVKFKHNGPYIRKVTNLFKNTKLKIHINMEMQ